MATKTNKTKPEQDIEIGIDEASVGGDITTGVFQMEQAEPKEPVEPKKRGPLDYIAKAIELTEALKSENDCREYKVAITALKEAQMFISKKGG